MTLPNFLIIGAAKSGTTALYEYVRQHPDIYMSPWKEPKFFAFDESADLDFRGPGVTVNETTVLDRDRYEALFDGADDEQILGEASALYLYAPEAAERIGRLVPEARLVAILRNPVDRAFSSYQHLVRDGREPLDFEDALAAEPRRIQENWGFLWRYVDTGFYAQQLSHYLDTFAEEQIRVYLYEDLRSDAVGVCQDIFAFLEVEDSFVPDTSLRHNVSGVPRNRLLHDLLNPPPSVKRWLWDVIPDLLAETLQDLRTRVMNRNLDRMTFPEQLRDELRDAFREDVNQLQEMIDRDLTAWLESTRFTPTDPTG